MKNLITFLILIISTTLFSQVGINTENPNQALDINGKIKIGDDAATPTEGTVRYNTSNQQFEGYNGTWNSLSENSNGPLPSNGVPIFARVKITPTGVTNLNITFFDWSGNAYSTVPNDKFFIITGLYPSAAESNPSSNNFTLNIGTNYTSTNGGSVTLSGDISDPRPLIGDQAPLLAIRPGDTFVGQSLYGTTADIWISFRGFMVDNLNY